MTKSTTRKPTTIEPNGETVRMPAENFDTLPGIVKAACTTYNNVHNGIIDWQTANQMNRAAATAVNAHRTMLTSALKMNVGNEMIARLCGIPPIAIAEKKEPQR